MYEYNNEKGPYSQKAKSQKTVDPNILMDSTSSNTEKKEKCAISQESIFNTKKNYPLYWRFDSTKKYWKSKISKFAEERLNKLIKESDLPEKLKNQIHKPNSLYFTANVKIKDNYNFLSYNLKDIFTIGKETDNLQKHNYVAFTKIYDYCNKIGNNGLSESIIKVKEFLEMKYEDLIKMFYDSDDFIVFKEECMTKFFDEGTIIQEGFSLLEDYGLIKVFKKLKKNSSKMPFIVLNP